MAQGNRNGEQNDRGRMREAGNRRSDWRERNENPDDPRYEGTYRPEGEDYHTHGSDEDRYRGREAMGSRGQSMRDRGGQSRGRGEGGQDWSTDYSEDRRRNQRDYRGYNFGDPYDQRNYESGGFGYGGTSGSSGGFGVGGAGPQTGGYGSQANYGEGYFGGRSSERDWSSGLGQDPDARYEPGRGRYQSSYNEQYPYSGAGRGQPYGLGYSRSRGRDMHHENYLNWRDNHVRSLDSEYEAYRAEHQTKFDTDFDTWRNNRPAEAKDKDKDRAKSNPTAGGQEAERVKKNH